MGIKTQLLEVLVCPQCKGTLAQVEGGQGLLCNRCRLKYPVRNGIPIMLVEEAVDMRVGVKGQAQAPRTSTALGGSAPGGSAPGATRVLGARGETIQFGDRVFFRVIAGANEGLRLDLAKGMCRALGRATGDPNKTAVLTVDWALSIDDQTKNLILQYISNQFRKPVKGGGARGPGELGAFKRGGDVILRDPSLSRLHAMVFFDEIGVGILDLVSKNGTFVNGEEVESRLLKKGDTIELGETKIVFDG